MLWFDGTPPFQSSHQGYCSNQNQSADLAATGEVGRFQLFSGVGIIDFRVTMFSVCQNWRKIIGVIIVCAIRNNRGREVIECEMDYKKS